MTSSLHFSWLHAAVLLPIVGSLWVSRLRDPERVRRRAIAVLAATLLLTIGAWIDYRARGAAVAHDRWDVLQSLAGRDVFLVDSLTAPLLPLAALLYLVTTMATPGTKVRRFAFGWNLISASILIATFCCSQTSDLVLLLTLGVIPPLVELRDRQKPMRVFGLHMGLFIALLFGGWLLTRDAWGLAPHLGAILLLAAVLLRSGIVPVHCWLTDLFEHATFGTALLFVTPMVGAYAAVRLVLPIAPDWMLRSIALFSIVTSVYAAGMAIVQKEARRFFCYIFLSHSSLILVGLEAATPVSLTGSLTVWLSDALALAGFGLTLRSVEARMGRVSLANYHGMYEHAPILAVFFLLTGLASIGFPFTSGFIGTELLVGGAVDAYPFIGMAVVLAAALNGIAVLQAYFRLFTGVRRAASISLRVYGAEKIAVLTLTALIYLGGLAPQPWITSRYQAALEIDRTRSSLKSPENHGPERGEVAWQSPADSSSDARSSH